MIPKIESGTASVGSEPNPEDMWDSKKWLQKYGLNAQKLSFYDVLADCSFRHADGVVDIKAKPENESIQTSAVSALPRGRAFSWCPEEAGGHPSGQSPGSTSLKAAGGKLPGVSMLKHRALLLTVHSTHGGGDQFWEGFLEISELDNNYT